MLLCYLDLVHWSGKSSTATFKWQVTFWPDLLTAVKTKKLGNASFILSDQIKIKLWTAHCPSAKTSIMQARCRVPTFPPAAAAFFCQGFLCFADCLSLQQRHSPRRVVTVQFFIPQLAVYHCQQYNLRLERVVQLHSVVIRCAFSIQFC